MPPAAPAPTQARRWVIVFALSLAIIQYIDRICISQAAPLISADLHLSPEQMGYVFSAFTLAYALFEIPAGYLGDRIGPRSVLLRIVLWWSFFTAATGWVRGFGSLVATRFLFGAGEAGCFPNLTKAFRRWLPDTERTRALALMWMFARWGGAATPLLVFACLQWMPWRTAFMVFGALGLVWALLFHRWYRNDPRSHPGVNDAEAALLPAAEPPQQDRPLVPWSKLVRSRTVWCLCGQYAACSYAWYFFITWFPTYLFRERGFDLKASALLAGTPLLLGGFGSLVAGWLTPWLATRVGGVGNARRALGGAGLFVGAALLVAVTRLNNPLLAVAAIAAVCFCNDITLPGAWAACSDVGGRFVATLGGAMNMMGNLGGFLCPIVIGHLTGSGHGWTPVFLITAAFYLLGAVLWLLMDPVTPLEEQCP